MPRAYEDLGLLFTDSEVTTPSTPSPFEETDLHCDLSALNKDEAAEFLQNIPGRRAHVNLECCFMEKFMVHTSFSNKNNLKGSDSE